MSGASALFLGSDDTIVALSTPAGRGAIALVRVSGRDAFAIASRVLRPWPAQPRVATLTSAWSEDGDHLDQVLAVRFEGPRSFTGQDVVEIGCHGGLAAPAAVLSALVAAGARPAEPGEFTRRAVLNGRLDLLQAEAIGDLIDAQSQRARRAAVEQLDGGLSRRVLALRDALIGLEALIAYDIDFPEEDDGPIGRDRILRTADDTLAKLDALLATARAGELVRAGALVVIAGAPNAGKSSLFNALLGRRRAIVTEIPGTTRDALEAVLDAGRWPLRLVDTAGLRDATDVVERLGVEVSEEYLGQADVVLACGDSGDALRHAVDVARARTSAPVIAVRTKADLDGGVAAGSSAAPKGADVVVTTSAESGLGLDALVETIERTLDDTAAPPALADLPMLMHERHRHAIAQARDELAAFRAGWAAGELPAPVAAVHLREGVNALEQLIGQVDVEDVLGRVFATFCVGK